MKFVCIDREDELSIKLKEDIKSFLIKKDFIYDENDPDYVISIGGDGTFLKSVNKYHHLNAIYLNINTGSFGYLCEFEVDEIDELLNNFLAYQIKEISLLECIIKNNNKSIDPLFMVDTSLYALNEFRIHSKRGKTIAFDVYINDNYFESLRGDGLIVSSSIGSSGITRSMGGALIDNELEILQLVEAGPILNCKYGSLHSSFVLNKDKNIIIKNINSEFDIFYDSSEVSCLNKDIELLIKLSDKKIKILKNPNKNYIKKTSELFTR